MSRLKYDVMRKLILAFSAASLVVSCTSISSTKVGKGQPSITTSHWTLADQVKGKTPTLAIEGEKISGNAGCNNYFGDISLDASTGRFEASRMGSTKMFCDNMSVEDNFLKVLSSANKYVVSGNHLELYKDGLLLMKLTKDKDAK